MNNRATKFMLAREKFHAARTPDTAKAYADAALVETDFGNSPRGPVLVAVANELKAGGYEAEAGEGQMIAEDIALEMSKLDREARAKIAVKMASGQLGEAFANLDRRHDLTIARGADRRAQPQTLLQEAA